MFKLSPTKMADPVKQICDENEVCREEALFYLEGFEWDLDSAMEACRNKTLPPLTVYIFAGGFVNDSPPEKQPKNQRIEASMGLSSTSQFHVSVGYTKQDYLKQVKIGSSSSK